VVSPCSTGPRACSPPPPTTWPPLALAGGAVGTALALPGTGAISGLGRLGAPVRVVTGWAPEGADLSVGEVVGTVVVSVAVGAALLALLERRSARASAMWVALAVTVAVVSALPLLHLEVDAHSKVALVAMQLTTGAAASAGHALVRLRAGRVVA
jgi:Family of unknown function (DUF6069)